MPKLTFGQRLRRLREQLPCVGISQGELARRAGVAKQQIQQWEAGRHVPSLGMAAKLAKALGVKVDEIL